MKKQWLTVFALSLYGAALAVETPTIGQTLNLAKHRSKVVVQGTLSKEINFDTFVLNDGTGDILLDLSGKKHDLKPGDQILAAGTFRRSPSLQNYRGEVLVSEQTLLSDDSGVKKLMAKFSDIKLPASPAETSTPSAPSNRSVSSRIEELEQLKSKNLITPEEYQEQRKRILNDL